MFGLGPTEFVIVAIVAVLLFGKRLPEVARSLGGSYQQFRKGLAEIQSTVDITGSKYSSPTYTKSYYRNETPVEDREEPTGPKLELPSPSTDDVAGVSETVNSDQKTSNS